jgi:hypothetical protein
MKRIQAFHPPFIAAYPVLALYSSNTSLVPISDLWRPLSVLVGSSFILWGLLYAALRDVKRSAVATSLFLIGLLGFGHATHSVTVDQREPLLVVWWLLFVVIGWIIVRKLYRPANTFLSVGSVVLVALASYNIVRINLTYRSISAVSQTSNLVAKRNDLPDVFYIILDGYGGESALKHAFGFSNRIFINELKKRGFYIADRSHTNYCETELSLASSLNLQYVSPLIKDTDPDSHDRHELDQLITNNEARRRFEQNGYRFIAITSGFPGIRFDKADLIKEDSTSYSLLETSLIQLAALPAAMTQLTSVVDERRRLLNQAFTTLEKAGTRTRQPRFIFVHILAPHPPFSFGPNGEPVRQKHIPYGYWDGSHYMSVGGTPKLYRDGYVGQVQYVNRRILEAIDSLLSRADTPPIIIIQGDHGSKSRLDQENLRGTDLQEVFPILNAYLAPKPIKDELYPEISPVNSLRTVLRVIFSDDLPNLRDKSYYSTWSKPYRFSDVSEKIAR